MASKLLDENSMDTLIKSELIEDEVNNQSNWEFPEIMSIQEELSDANKNDNQLTKPRNFQCIACEFCFFTSRTLKKHFKTKKHELMVTSKCIDDPAFNRHTWIVPNGLVKSNNPKIIRKSKIKPTNNPLESNQITQNNAQENEISHLYMNINGEHVEYIITSINDSGHVEENNTPVKEHNMPSIQNKQRSIEDIRDRPYQCLTCENQFLTKKVLKKHFLTLNHKRVAKERNLDSALHFDTWIRPEYYCKHCNLEYKTINHMLIHRKIHH